MERLASLLILLGSLLFVRGQNIPQACLGSVGSYQYNLTDLANYYLTADATAVDPNNNVYYFRPCQVLLNSNCQTGDDPTPAGCMKDTRRPAQYHDLGTIVSATFSQLSGYGPDQGFLLSFSGGQNDRRFDVAFYCDPDAGQGSLVVANPAEQPQLDYHLQWRTAYACPTNSTNPAQGFECCLYEYSKEPEKTKALCLDNSNGNEQCPGSLGSYEFIGQWQVDNCSDCYFHDRRSARAQIARL